MDGIWKVAARHMSGERGMWERPWEMGRKDHKCAGLIQPSQVDQTGKTTRLANSTLLKGYINRIF